METNRGSLIPDWAYRDVLFMLIHYSIAAFELLERKLTINENKTVLSTKKYRRVVTGLVLANDGRVTIGRDRKRNIRAALRRAFLGKLDAEDAGRLAGLIAYIKGVEPAYFDELTLRYGADLIEKLNSPFAGRP